MRFLIISVDGRLLRPARPPRRPAPATAAPRPRWLASPVTRAAPRHMSYHRRAPTSAAEAPPGPLRPAILRARERGGGAYSTISGWRARNVLSPTSAGISEFELCPRLPSPRYRTMSSVPLIDAQRTGSEGVAQRGTSSKFVSCGLDRRFLGRRSVKGGRPGRTTATYLAAIASALALSLVRPSANVLAATNAPVFLLLPLLFR